MHTTTGRPLAPRGVTSPLNCRLPGVRLRCPPRGCTTGRQATFGPADVESLIPDTLEDMAQDAEFQRTAERLRREGQAALTREERMKRQRSLDNLGVPSFYKMVQDGGVTTLKRSPAKIFQLNIGLYCNQACTHCHVESSPKRTEMMSKETADRCIELLKSCHTVNTLDITGGAPELNSQFRYLVKEAAELGIDIIDRCNLTVLLEPGQEDLPQFLADHKVHVVASLPCYSEKNVNKQRGAGVFERSIWGLQALNRLGYGQEGTGLNLDLVYNPGGPSLAPPQATLEAAYKQELMDAHGIEFNRLFCLNNMPIKRFADFLIRRGKLDEYMQLLLDNFNPAAAEGLMCRDTVNVGWDGRIYDCDFNQQLEIGAMRHGENGSKNDSKGPVTVFNITSLDELTGGPIACDNHCFGCTAGAGSSCQGETV
ncbi:unnamed protein product [Ostreobium quekettii]|uniref:Fe-S oxidoreductase n=1 Tax=Ostreobium quekettii TaxID=121088 RepID=A0A8S1J7J9_9CHLO|nr:unnamed protein product [Ostreobium quekettii]